MQYKYTWVFLLALLWQTCYSQNDSLSIEKPYRYKWVHNLGWGGRFDVSSSFKPQYTLIGAGVYLADSAPNVIIDLATATNFKNNVRNTFSLRYTGLMPFALGVNVEYSLIDKQSIYSIAPCLAFDMGFIALEYSRRVVIETNSPMLIPKNTISIIFRPRIILNAYSNPPNRKGILFKTKYIEMHSYSRQNKQKNR